MKKHLIFVLTIFNIYHTYSQPVFQKIYGLTGDNIFGSSMVQTSDSGFAITGMHINFVGAGAQDAILLKTNSGGDLQWMKSYGSNNYEFGNCIKQTSDGGYIIAGGASGSSSAGATDMYLIKTNSSGTLSWSRTYGGTFNDVANSVVQTNDGGFLIVGYTNSFGAGMEDMYIVKVDSNGNLAWSKVIGTVGFDWINSIELTSNGEYVLTGLMLRSLVGQSEAFLMKMDTVGNVLWLKSYTENNYAGEGNSCHQTNDDGFIISGTAHQTLGGIIDDIILVKTDSSGNLQWRKTFDAGGDDRGFDARQTNDGGYIACGSSNSASNAFLIKTDTSGNLQWSKAYGGNNNDAASTVIQLGDGTYVLSGMTQNFALGDGSVYLVRTDSNGVSGCNENNITYTVTTPASQTMIPFPTDTIGGVSGIPAPITVNSGALTTLCSSSVNVNEIAADFYCRVIPNPSFGSFSIIFPEHINNGEIEILTAFGTKIVSAQINNEVKKEFNLKNISSGIYFIKVLDGEKIFTQKLIIQ